MVLNYVVTNYSGSPLPAFYYATKVQLFSETTKHFANYFRFIFNKKSHNRALGFAACYQRDARLSPL